MILLESNQNHATARDTEVCTTRSASMGMGGGYVPMVVDALPFDTTQVTSPMNYSAPHWGDACHPLASNQHPPAAVIKERTDDMSYQETTGSLMASGYSKLGTQEAANDMYVTEPRNWDGTQISPTLTARNAGGGQRMPDKENFNAVIQPVGFGADMGKDADTFAFQAIGAYKKSDAASALKMRDYKDATDLVMNKKGGDAMDSVVRRLTPLE